MRNFAFSLLVVIFSFPWAARAEPFPAEKVPEPLKSWVQWALDGHEEARCPILPEAQRQCFWPGRLELVLEDRQGRFKQDWQAFKDGWVLLPGDAKHWPQDVLVDGRPAVVISREEAPRLRLGPGGHSISGQFRWDSVPELIQIPAETGLVALTIRGKKVEFPNRDEQGRLWLQKAAGRQEGESRLEVVVHRRVADEIPLLLETDVELKVSGKNREVLLGKALPAQFVPMELEGPLPARLERDGRLRVQVRPGYWRLRLSARHEGPVLELKMPVNSGASAGQWDKEEVWVFDARPNLRLASIEGVSSVDPQQTELPAEWKNLPAYLMREGDALRFAERRRGDADPVPDELSLNRVLWLDFDGGGYSVKDHVEGILRRSWRMEMAEPTHLGRVAVGGADQFITALKPEAGRPKIAGIEIRQGSVQVDADSRIEDTRFTVPAVGWNHDFHQVSGTLNLPPGWRLIHAFGVDDASQTWISRWTLLDLFMVLMLALSVAKLWGAKWGALSLAALALCYHEPGSPRWTWVYLLACEALARGLSEGSLRDAVVKSRILLRAALVLVAIPFLVTQIRVGFFPQLELEYQYASSMPRLMSMLLPTYSLGELASNTGEEKMFAPANTSNVPPSGFKGVGSGEAGNLDELKAAAANAHGMFNKGGAPSPAVPASRGESLAFQLSKARQSLAMASSGGEPIAAPNMNLYAPDIKARVSTGPGLPTWNWNSVSLTWRGPVIRSQRMRLILIGPLGNLILALVRAGLLVIFALCVLGVGVEDALRRLRGFLPAALMLALAIPLLEGRASAEMPSAEMLKDLQGRLLRPAECEPLCASIPRLRIEATAGVLRLKLEVSAAAPSGVPLPGGAKQWTPSEVLLDGAPAKGLLRSPDGSLLLPVGPGTHQVSLQGPMPDRETLEIALPLKPQRVEASASGWTVDGVREDGVPDENLQFTRVRGSKQGGPEILQAGSLPPFLRVERDISLGLSWKVRTRVSRATPLGTAVVLEVPLLPGESVTSPDIRVEKGRAKLSMGPQAEDVSWESVLGEGATLKLQAPVSASWTEVWRLDASPIWHVVAEGIPVVHSEDAAGTRLREWRPWPGESVTLDISRPEGVAGQTLTIDRSALTFKPGLRAADAALELVFRSSRGAQQILTLPEGAQLQALSMDGTPQPVRQEKRDVTVPILPGSHQVSVTWRQENGIGTLYRIPEVKLGVASVNSKISVSVPRDRWILLIGGPRLGPAVLFWGLLAVMALVSLGLEKLSWIPLRARDWFLLSIGLTQVPLICAALFAGWLLALGVRRSSSTEDPLRFNLVQCALAGWTVAALFCLYWAIQQGLLGQPEMQISGNGSWANSLHWYQDRAGDILPRPWLFSLPRMVYRFAMLGWALWIASSLLNWLRWGWSCVNEGGLWKQVDWAKRKKT